MTQSRVLQFLKDGTARQHEAVEQRMDLPHRLCNPSTYSALLGYLYGFYLPVESALGRVAGYAEVGLSLSERRKAALLAADLTALGQQPEDQPLLTRPPEYHSLGQALGCMYVLEGATLGGRIITRMVEERLGFTPGRGCAFFAGYGERTGAMWTAFRAALTGYATSPQVEGEITTAASETFTLFDQWLAAEGAL